MMKILKFNQICLNSAISGILVCGFSQTVWAGPENLSSDPQIRQSPLDLSESLQVNVSQDLFLGTQLNMPQAAPLRERPLQAAGWNLLPIFGYGSHQQGDAFGGTVLGVLDGITWATFLVGFSPLGGNYQFFTYFMIGSASFLAGRIFGVIAPFTYAENQRALQLETLVQGDVAPGVKLLTTRWLF